MASNKNAKNKKSLGKAEPTTKKPKEEKTFEMKVLIFLGVVISCVICVYLMNYFFVQKSYIKINISTDKRVDTINVSGNDETILTQKYVSDLGYSMRYDISTFKVVKYKKQDMFKYNKAEKILVIVEKSSIPNNCITSGDEVHNSCVIIVDDYTKVYYVKEQGQTYKITVKTPDNSHYNDEIKSRINFMLSTFEVN